MWNVFIIITKCYILRCNKFCQTPYFKYIPSQQMIKDIWRGLILFVVIHWHSDWLTDWLSCWGMTKSSNLFFWGWANNHMLGDIWVRMDGSWHIPDLSYKYLRHILDTFLAYLWNILGIYVANTLGIYLASIGLILGISWEYLGYIRSISWSYIFGMP